MRYCSFSFPRFSPFLPRGRNNLFQVFRPWGQLKEMWAEKKNNVWGSGGWGGGRCGLFSCIFFFSRFFCTIRTPGTGLGERKREPLGSLRSNDGDCNENSEKTIGFISNTTTLHVHHAFCTFLSRRFTTST